MTTDYISEDSFMDDYRPITLGADGDQIVQTYGQAQLAAQDRDLSDNHIWSIVEGGDDGSLFASPGYHAVNVVGFVVTENPWRSEVVDAVWLDGSDFDADLDDEEDEEGESVRFGPGM